jgi:hypothetical protein
VTAGERVNTDAVPGGVFLTVGAAMSQVARSRGVHQAGRSSFSEQPTQTAHPEFGLMDQSSRFIDPTTVLMPSLC